jgi:hypothetical protein
MTQRAVFSRRAALGSLAATPLLATAAMSAATTSSADAHLLALGQTFDRAAAEIDQRTEHGSDLPWDLLKQLDCVDEIVATPATSIEGLCVKARAACWALLGDLDPDDNMTVDRKMALSIFRDLICLHDPSLEHPGALKKLVGEIEAGASEAVATVSVRF